jgi:hypothetical protein
MIMTIIMTTLPLGRPRHESRIISKWKQVWHCGLDSCGSEEEPMAEFCKCGNGLSGFI